MKCPACASNQTRVTCTDHYIDFTKRYCCCLACNIKFRTVEKYETLKPGPPKGKPRTGNISRGEQNGQSILTESNVHHIRTMYASGSTLQAIADHYGFSKPHISRIVNRKLWTHI